MRLLNFSYILLIIFKAVQIQSKDFGTEDLSFRFQFAAGKKRSNESDGEETNKRIRLTNLPKEKIDGWEITAPDPDQFVHSTALYLTNHILPIYRLLKVMLIDLALHIFLY